MDKALTNLIVCPGCGQDLTHRSSHLECNNCRAEYPIEDGIFDMRRAQQRQIPELYDDPSYKKMESGLVAIHARHYAEGSLSRWVEDQYKKDILRLYVDDGELRVDIGCGAGSGYPFIGDPAKIVGVDRNMNLLKECKKRYPLTQLVCCDFAESPFRPHSFSTLLAMSSIEHMFELEAVLRNMHRMVQPHGHVYILIPTEGGVAWELARQIFTLRYNGRIVNLSPAEYLRAAKIEHCNTALAIDSAVRKFFRVEKRRLWPLRFGGINLNLAVSYRLKPLLGGALASEPVIG
jgi:SAM-dependent methyltransferase